MQDLHGGMEPEEATDAAIAEVPSRATIQNNGLGTQTCHCAQVLP